MFVSSLFLVRVNDVTLRSAACFSTRRKRQIVFVQINSSESSVLLFPLSQLSLLMFYSSYCTMSCWIKDKHRPSVLSFSYSTFLQLLLLSPSSSFIVSIPSSGLPSYLVGLFCSPCVYVHIDTLITADSQITVIRNSNRKEEIKGATWMEHGAKCLTDV